MPNCEDIQNGFNDIVVEIETTIQTQAQTTTTIPTTIANETEFSCANHILCNHLPQNACLVTKFKAWLTLSAFYLNLIIVILI